MRREGAIIFSDLIGKVDMLRIESPQCDLPGQYQLADLIMRYGKSEICLHRRRARELRAQAGALAASRQSER